MNNPSLRLRESISRLLRRRRLQRGLEWLISGLLLSSLLALVSDLPSAPGLPPAALIIALPPVLFSIGGLLPIRRDLLIYQIDRRLGLGAALLTADSLLLGGKPLNEIEKAQLKATADRLSRLSPVRLLPWEPPATLLALPFLILLVPALWLWPDSSTRESDSRREVREIARRLAVRGEETEDPRFSDLARLLDEFIRAPDRGAEKRAKEGEELGRERPRGLERIPPVEEGAEGSFDYDQALEELFRLAPGRSEEGYSLSRSLAEALGLDEGDLQRLDEQIAELDEERSTGTTDPRRPPGAGDAEGPPGSGGGDEPSDSRASPDGREGAGEDLSGPGGGSGGREGEEGANGGEERESGRSAGGTLEELGGRRSSEEQLRGALRYLSPEGRALVEERGIEADYTMERESAVGGRQLEGPDRDFVGDYFELLNRRQRE